jgi:hypothetical protein
VILGVVTKGIVYDTPHMPESSIICIFLLYPSSSCRTLQNEVKKDKENKMILYIYEIIIS